MLIFDEEKYASHIIKNKKYDTIKSQGKERCILVRYLNYKGLSENEIEEHMDKIPMAGGEYLTKSEKKIIYQKIIKKALNYEFIHNIKITIYKKEVDIINSLEDDNLKNLLFVLLVYYKWAKNVDYLKFYSKNNNIDMVVEKNNDLWSLANLKKYRVSERYKLCNSLYNKGLYKIDNFKTNNYIYIPFICEDGEIAFEFDSYENILGEFNLYNDDNNYKRCCVCGTVITKTRSPKKYCEKCARLEKIKKTIENRIVEKPNL